MRRFTLASTALFTTATLGFLLAPSPAQVQINWNTPVTISGDSDVLNVGQVLSAWDFYAPTTVNGVAFSQGLTNAGALDSYISLASFNGGPYNGYGSAGTFTTLSTDYQSLLAGAVYADAAPDTVTLDNLAFGHQYAVQLWVNDSRGATLMPAPKRSTAAETCPPWISARRMWSAASANMPSGI